MSDLAVAAVLAGAILLASTVSVELGISVALIELFAGVDRRQRVQHRRPELAELHRVLCRDPAHVPRRRRGRRPAAPPGVESVRVDRARLVRRALRRRRPARLLRARLEPSPGRDRGDRALHDQPRGRLCGSGRDRPQPDAGRQAPDVGDLRHRPGTVDRADDPLHQADDLDDPVRRRVAGADLRPAADRPVVLPPLRRPRDRAGDQARLRLPLPALVARRPCQLPSRATRVHPRPGDEQPLPGAPARSRSGCGSSPLRS